MPGPAGFLTPIALIELGAYLVALEVTPVITTGSIIVGLITAAAALIAVAYGARYKVGYEAASAAANELRKSLDDAHDVIKRLEARLAEQATMIADQRSALERLEQLPNLERVIKLMTDTADRQEQRAQDRLTGGLESVRRFIEHELEEHELRAVERHEALLAAYAALVARVERSDRRTT